MIDFNYIVENYSSKEQQERYGKRALNGLHISEKILVNKHFTDGTTLDVGTGCGRFAIGAYEMGYTDMHGIDINDAWIQYAKNIALTKGYNIKFSTQNAICTNFDDNMFKNIIFTSDGFAQIPGIENRIKALKEMLRILKEGGVFIFTTPEAYFTKVLWPDDWKDMKAFKERQLWKSNNFYDNNDVPIKDGGYINYTPIEETLEILEKIGFEVLGDKSTLGLTKHIIEPKSSNVSHYFIVKKRKSIL